MLAGGFLVYVCSSGVGLFSVSASGVADVFEEDSEEFGQSCSMLVGLGCPSVVVVVVGEVFEGGAVHVWVHFQAYTLGV